MSSTLNSTSIKEWLVLFSLYYLLPTPPIPQIKSLLHQMMVYLFPSFHLVILVIFLNKIMISIKTQDDKFNKNYDNSEIDK